MKLGLGMSVFGVIGRLGQGERSHGDKGLRGRAEPHLLRKFPLQALRLRQGGVGVPLTVAICSVAQLEALCGQGKLWAELAFTSLLRP